MIASRALRAIVIGAGPAAVALHLPVLAALAARGRLFLSVVCDLDRLRALDAQERFGFEAISGDATDALARPDLDAVYIFGSAQMHFSIGLAALRAGKHLFVEKPIAPSYAQACQLAEAARNRGCIAVGGHNRRFYRAFDELRRRGGSLGWRYAEASFHKPDARSGVPFGAATWLGANGIHALDALLYMMGGTPEYLSSLASDPEGLPTESFSALMRWADGGQGLFSCHNSAGARHESYVFHRIGETYRVSDRELKVEKGGNIDSLPLVSLGDGIEAEHESFLHAIETGEAPPHNIAALAPSLFVAELVESGFTGVLPCRSETTSVRPRRVEPAILVSQPAALLPAISRWLPEHRLVALEDIRDAPAERGDIVAALLGKGSEPLTASTLGKLPRLSIVGVMGLSLARHSPAALLARGVTVINASAAYANSAAEFTLALAILARRRAFASHELMRAKGWGSVLQDRSLRGRGLRAVRRARPWLKAMGLEPRLRRWWQGSALRSPAETLRAQPGDLRGARVGLIGWGAISQRLTQLLIGIEAAVLVYSEHAAGRDVRAAGAVPASLLETLACDIVSLHRGLTPKTRHCLKEAELAALRPGSVLINTARGALIDPNALLRRLRHGDVFACLDSFDEEPLPSRHALRQLPNVFLTSHIAGGSPDMHAAAADEVVRKVALHLQGVTSEGISLSRLSTMT
ncbi:MAG TPA: NAD(P)-dependent oxidoreductase [Steroidobacteraceae bacterium]|jgi:phosphoglycerate dehydrogenase-like enzyme/predicted dehydrogenase